MYNKIVSGLFKDNAERRQKAAEILESIQEDKDTSPYITGYFAEMAGDFIPLSNQHNRLVNKTWGELHTCLLLDNLYNAHAYNRFEHLSYKITPLMIRII